MVWYGGGTTIWYGTNTTIPSTKAIFLARRNRWGMDRGLVDARRHMERSFAAGYHLIARTTIPPYGTILVPNR